MSPRIDNDGKGPFRVRGWSASRGWVDCDAPHRQFMRGGAIVDLDVALSTALEMRESHARVEVLDREGEILATVERRWARLPRLGEVSAMALPFLAAALRLEVAAKVSELQARDEWAARAIGEVAPERER